MSAAQHLVELPPVSPGPVRLVEPDEPALVTAEAAVEAHDNDRALAEVYGQASKVAEHERQWLLARCYAEKARERFARLGDPIALGKILHDLGRIHFLLGDADRAVECLEQALALGLEHDDTVLAGCATSSLAQVLLREGDPGRASREARRALELLADRPDQLDEVGGAQLVLARSLLAQGRHDEADELCAAAEGSFERLGSPGRRSAAWLARGDVARARGEHDAALDLYRRAAEDGLGFFGGS